MSKVIEVISINPYEMDIEHKQVILKSQVIGVKTTLRDNMDDDDYFIILKYKDDIMVSHKYYLEILYFLQN